MKKLAIIGAGFLALTACGGIGSSPDVIIPTSADNLERVTYTESQVATYKLAIEYEGKQLNLIEGMTLDFNQPDAAWEPFVTRAKAFCDDARSSNWDAAENRFTEQLKAEVENSLPSGIDLSVVDLTETAKTLIDTQLRAIAAEDSLCPELAPPNFGTVIDASKTPNPTGDPLTQGKYYGEGCQAAGEALLDLLVFLDDIQELRGDMESMNERLTNIAAGLQYASMTEPDAVKSAEISAGIESVIRLQLVFSSGDADGFGKALGQASQAAVDIIDTCGL